MVIDISAHLRRLVMAGLPLVGAAGCPAPVPGSPGGEQPLLAGSICQPRMIQEFGGGAKVIELGFEANDPGVGDLYVSCTTDGDYCGRLCSEALVQAHPTLSLPMGHTTFGPMGCELKCDQHGRPVLRVAFTTGSPGVPGRRPEGFHEQMCAGPGTGPGAFFADCARLEGASITAFVVLAGELDHHGAPRPLIDRARRAARDETRHFAQTNRLARLFGAAPVRCPRPPRPPVRDLATLARENAVEGCVNETYAAAVALWQSASAENAAVRSTLAAIAEDELSHAQLAWDVHEWSDARLTSQARAEVKAARVRAGRRLGATSALPIDRRLQVEVGLPGPDAARGLVDRMQPLWA